jgi:carbon-monoxide dehydrogenase catalytic subunit
MADKATKTPKKKKKQRTPEEASIDPAAQQMLAVADEMGVGTAFSRADAMSLCPIGSVGMCCDICSMGPCRITADGQTGVCGATIDTIQARNFIRSVAAGSAAHSDHGRDMAFTLKAVANGEAEGYAIRDIAKLHAVAALNDIPVEDRSPEEIANDLADIYIAQFGQQNGEIAPVDRAPEKRQKLWKEQGVIPRGVDREVVEALHRTHMGDDQDPTHILHHAVRTALADGWGGSMIATDISDILFGTPAPLLGEANLGVLSHDMVNVIVHGHEPTLSQMVVAASQDPEIIEYAKNAGAKGINLSGICCTANEILMRQGIPAAGNFLQQELAILTGSVEAMVVDVQCIMQGLVSLAENFHTKIITTSPKVKITGAKHIEFDEHHALTIAKNILKESIDNYANRGDVNIPDYKNALVPGFSHEYINYMLGGSYRASFRPLNDAIMSGRIRGVAAIVGCTNPRVQHDAYHVSITEELLKQDVLVVETGCSAIANAKLGFLLGDAGIERVGPGLREVCETVGIPPVLHMGSCGAGARHRARVDEREGALHRHLLRRFRRVRDDGRLQPGRGQGRQGPREHPGVRLHELRLGGDLRRQAGVREGPAGDDPARARSHRQETRRARAARVRPVPVWKEWRRPTPRDRGAPLRRTPGRPLRPGRSELGKARNVPLHSDTGNPRRQCPGLGSRGDVEPGLGGEGGGDLGIVPEHGVPPAVDPRHDRCGSRNARPAAGDHETRPQAAAPDTLREAVDAVSR